MTYIRYLCFRELKMAVIWHTPLRAVSDGRDKQQYKNVAHMFGAWVFSLVFAPALPLTPRL